MELSSDRPRLRPLEAYPTVRGDEALLTLRDPARLTDAMASLPPAAAAVVELFDGERDRDQICRDFERRRGQPLARAALDALIEQLDQALLLDSERFRRHAAEVWAAFARSPVRPPFHAGHSYPGDPPGLRATLDGHLDGPLAPPRPRRGDGPRPRALVAPHVDFGRGGAAYAWAYRALLASAERPPDLVVVLGTDHSYSEHPFTLTRKHYHTPLGGLTTDLALCDRLVAEAGGAALLSSESHHRSEHSIEFQVVWLRHVYGPRADGIRVLPVLCGSLHQHLEGDGAAGAARATGPFLAALGRLLSGRQVLWIAGADLAHVGPRYGDPRPLEAADRERLEQQDRQTLEPVLRGDGAGWFEAIRREGDRRRVCGLSPIFALLQALSKAGAAAPRGTLAAYAQCPAEPGSIVSIASVVFG